ncbi:hypothetical protein EJB05_36810, partial [Eragrostis curvula]
MPMAPVATRAPPRLLSKSSFLAPSPNAKTTVRLGRRVGMNRAVILGVAPRDPEWGADPNASSGSGGRMVDEDMATLRRRIREARAAALSEDDDDDTDSDTVSDADDGVPGGWTELERRHHGSYAAGVRGAACLLEARPGVGAVVVALLLLGVPASVLFLACAKLIQAVDTISSAVIGR